MYRLELAVLPPVDKSPHRRGDVPHEFKQLTEEHAISPQTWGCTVPALAEGVSDFNLPTDVGMYRGRRNVALLAK